MSSLSRGLASAGSWIVLVAAAVELVAGSASETTAVLSPTSTPTEAPPTTEDPVQRHLAAIIGVPTGFLLALLLIGSCVVWLMLSSYLKYRRAEREQATNTTHLNSASKGATGTGGRHHQHDSEPCSEGGGTVPTSPLSPSPHSPSPHSPSPHSPTSTTFPITNNVTTTNTLQVSVTTTDSRS